MIAFSFILNKLKALSVSPRKLGKHTAFPIFCAHILIWDKISGILLRFLDYVNDVLFATMSKENIKYSNKFSI